MRISRNLLRLAVLGVIISPLIFLPEESGKAISSQQESRQSSAGITSSKQEVVDCVEHEDKNNEFADTCLFVGCAGFF